MAKHNITIENRAARHEYFVEETLECGIELRGNEVKSIREGKASIKEAWVDIEDREMFIKGMHITPWSTANSFDVDVKRNKKLLAHKSEIKNWADEVKKQGFTIVPLKIYFNDKGKCKMLIGLCKGKKLYDKRQSDKEATAKMDMRRAMK